MKLVEVIPIAKNVFGEEQLSYFTIKDVGPGAIVSIPLRRRIVPALVVSTSQVKNVKSMLRQSPYKLKRIENIKTSSLLLPEFLQAAKTLSLYFASPLGAVLKTLIPSRVLQKSDLYSVKDKRPEYLQDFHYETLLIQASLQERLQYYKSIIREEFARHRTVFFCVPTVMDIESISQELNRGIEEYTIILHNDLPARKLDASWKKGISEYQHPLLIIATGFFLSLPRKDIGAIIVEKENSDHYKIQTRPYIDLRKAAEEVARAFKSRLILGDEIVRIEDYLQKEQGNFLSPLFHISRPRSNAKHFLIDMRKQSEFRFKPETFAIISSELKDILKNARDRNERSLLFINRRGHSPTTICNDCGKILTCAQCNIPLVLHINSNNKRAFICHKCFLQSPIPSRCPYCKSWKLISLGIGIQKVKEELQRILPYAEVFILTKDEIKNKKQGKEVIKKFLDRPGSILLGTEFIFSFLDSGVDPVRKNNHFLNGIENVAVISLDALFAIPDFRIPERIFHTLLRLKNLATKTFLIQTRLPEHYLFNYILRGSMLEFFRSELQARKELQYPPFSILIKITRQANRLELLKKEIRALTEQLSKPPIAVKPLDFPAFITKIKGKYQWHILLKLKPECWPEKYPELVKFLINLPPNWKVDVDPVTLL